MRSAAALFLCALHAGGAHAEPPRSIHVVSNGCPDASAVVVALKALMPSAAVAEGPGVTEVRVVDEGDRFRVTVGDVERTLEDAPRRCEDRARAVAVVADLSLSPPSADGPVRRPPPAVFVDVVASGRFELAPNLGSGGTLPTGGAELRLEAGWTWIAASVGVRGLGPVSPAFETGRASLVRVPIDVGARFALRRGRFEMSGLVGVALAALRLEGQGLVRSLTETRFDPAAHLVLALRVWQWSRVAIETSVGLDVAFQPLDLVVDPVGIVGKTPRLWLGLGVGFVFRAKNAERKSLLAPMRR